MSPRATPPTPSVELRGITVSFGSLVALDKVDLSLAPGERHAVVGENGAGKSTLMKTLFGLVTPNAGEILVGKKPRCFPSPADAIALGIGMVQQHFELVGSFTACENIVMGDEPRGFLGILDRKQANEAVRALADESGLTVDLSARVDELSVASQQRVEILKALYRRARVLILDEPTAVLAPAEARDLWASVARLSQAGTTIVFITHKLDDVMAHADSVTVLRRGKRIVSTRISDTTPALLAAAMIGNVEKPAETAPPQATSAITRETVLSLHGLSVLGRRGETVVDKATLDVRGGEILGLAGVDGSGQVELLEAIIGLRAAASGTITLGKVDITLLSVAARRDAGVGYVPEDRHHRALILPFSCEENAVLGQHRLPVFAAFGFLRRGAITNFLRERAASFDVRGANPETEARSLSGGNQQKLVLARELSRAPRVLLAAQPTRGLDFAASAFVHNALRGERDRGAAIVLQSLDLDEVLSLSDRVAVLLAGRIVAVLNRAEATEARVGALMTGAEAGE